MKIQKNEIYKGNCLTLMRDVDVGSVDAVITDIVVGHPTRFFVDAAFQFMIPFIPLILSDMGMPGTRIDIVAGVGNTHTPGFL